MPSARPFAARILLSCYALTTLLSAFLLFQVQPIISKFLLPWYGGSTAVWTTCVVFFQTVLFAGYAYAHCSERWLSRKWQLMVHLVLLMASLAALPIAPDASWKLSTTNAPAGHILALLAVSVGLPYFTLSSTGPLLQAWFARSFPGRSPYRLYALSNVGSMVGLLSYPFVIEPRLSLSQQTGWWELGFIAFALCCAAAAWKARRQPKTDYDSNANDRATTAPSRRTRAAWLAIPGLASAVLLAMTHHVCQDVAVMPLLWVVPLSLYLLSFILCFDHPRWYLRSPFALGALVLLSLVALVDQLITAGSGIAIGFIPELLLHFAALFSLCMVCHGELYRLRPQPRYLTSFYLHISAGGALGGLLVSLVAPVVFHSLVEWRIGLVLGCLLSAYVLVQGTETSFLRKRFAPFSAALLIPLVGIKCWPIVHPPQAPPVDASARNFYGVVAVLERNVNDPAEHLNQFYSGRIVHGLQFAAPNRQAEPTAYYGRRAGIGQLLAHLADRDQLRVGLVGLGVGTLASYAQPGHNYRFYELNPQVLEFAQRYFTFLRDCRGTVETILGDARLSLEQESPQHFDLLVLDAFSGDSVPTHLLTQEAAAIYGRHLASDGRIAIHISNRYLDLRPIIAGLAQELGMTMQVVRSPSEPELGTFSAEWVILSLADAQPTIEWKSLPVEREPQGAILWTDAYSNLFEILK